MNKQNVNGIEWCHFTWNPITGCKHNCPYCYVPRALRFVDEPMKPRFHMQRLTDKMPKKPSRIFVGSTGDMWGDWVPESWIQKVLDIVEKNDEHRFIFLTKNPIRYSDFSIPDNAWCGTSIDGDDYENRIGKLISSAPADRAFLSLEPFTESPSFVGLDDAERLKWIIIGGLTGKKPMVPKKDDVDCVLDFASLFDIPVFIKHNAKYPVKLKDYPVHLQV